MRTTKEERADLRARCRAGVIAITTDAALVAALVDDVEELDALVDRFTRERDEERRLADIRGEMLTACERDRDAMGATIDTMCLVDLDPYDGCRMPLVGPNTRENVVTRVATLEAAYRRHAQSIADVREALLDAFADADGGKVTTLARAIRDLTDERDEARAERDAYRNANKSVVRERDEARAEVDRLRGELAEARDNTDREVATLAALTLELAEARAERDARPEITAEDAALFVRRDHTDADALDRVCGALRAHAGKVAR